VGPAEQPAAADALQPPLRCGFQARLSRSVGQTYGGRTYGKAVLMTDFTRVLLTDKIAWELFGLAARERMLYSSDTEETTPTPGRGAVSQRALSFLVLFDNIIIHDFSTGAFRIPDLESEGILQVITRGSLPVRSSHYTHVGG
jgi:hypothetical protein